jgi:diguanylate cyclase (GGDEF)-like protein
MTFRTLKSFAVPGGVLLLCTLFLVGTGLLKVSLTTLQVFYYVTSLAGILLALRFHTARIIFALLTILLAYRAIDFFSPHGVTPSGPGHIALEAIAVLVPLNFILISFSQERALALPSLAPPIAIVFFESVFVAVLCRPGARVAPGFIHNPLIGHGAWGAIPQVAVFLFVAAVIVLAAKLIRYRQPVQSGLFWSAVATLFGLHAGVVGNDGTAYFGTAGLILVSSIIENTYALAYQDELTGLPSRRAFNEALSALSAPYSIAVVDIDHFKSFNDTYGHDTGDEVLRLVARKLADVTGGGHAYRVGGEEFSILFSGKAMAEVLDHLEALRATIQTSTFRVRGAPERRAESRGPDRRNADRPNSSKKPRPKKVAAPTPEGELSVTVSIGVAEPSSKTLSPEEVIHSADKALYRAKHGGRNRVEAFRSTRSPRRPGRSIAS